MARFAPVAPPELLSALRKVSDFVCGRYHLLLAHDVAARPTLYKAALPAQSFIIMDNSMVELGHPVDGSVVEAACAAVQSDIVVLPDVKGNADETVRLSKAAVKEWKFHKHSFMAVPQGQNYEEMEDCAKRLWELPQVGHWGVPRTAVEFLGSRGPITSFLAKLGTKTAKGWSNIHLLGFSGNLQHDIDCSKISGVMGIDSAVPVRQGQRKQLISKDQQDPGPRGDFWENPWFKAAYQDPPHVGVVQAETIANLYLVRSWTL